MARFILLSGGGIDVESVVVELDEAKDAEARHEMAEGLAFELGAESMLGGIDELLRQGISEESIRVNGTAGLALYDAVVRSDEAISSEAKGRAYGRLLRLYGCRGLNFGGGKLDRGLLYSGDYEAEGLIGAVEDCWEGVLDTHYETYVASERIKDYLDGAVIINIQGATMAEKYSQNAAVLRAEEAVIRELGSATHEMSNRLFPDTPTKDFVLQGFVEADLNEADMHDQLARLSDAMDIFNRFSDDQKYVVRSADVPSVSAGVLKVAQSMKEMSVVMQFYDQIAEAANVDKVDMVAPAAAIYRAVKRLGESGENASYLEGAAHEMQQIFAIHRETPAWDWQTISGMLENLGDSRPRDIAATETMRSFLQRHPEEANNAMRLLSVRPEADWRSALEVYQGLERPYDELVGLMIACQPEQEDRAEAYYALAKQTLHRMDKNGVPYSSPMALRDVVESPMYTPENIAWFLSGDVPVAVFNTVNRFRNIVRSRGVDDVPDAVYRYFCDNPEFIAEESTWNMRDYVSGICPGHDTGALIEAARADAEARKAAFRVFINIDPVPLQNVINNTGGSLKSLLDTDIVDRKDVKGGVGIARSRTAEYLYHRADVEAMIGVRVQDDNDQHPIYGSCGFIDQGVPGGATGYGAIMLSFRLDAKLREKTTYTPEDSFNRRERLVEEDAAALRIIKSGNGDGFMRTDEYVEAQITGGISVMDVAEIFVPEELVERVRRIMPSSLANRVIAVPYGVDDFINRDLAYDKLHDKALVERYRNNAVEGTDMVTGSGVAAGGYGDQGRKDSVPVRVSAGMEY